ncbi:MAG TPA: biopolymer transporter ExbD [Spirochaetia bacterium]|nr:biopolymer transporter ExbD [Spirochaetia bacterium]
MIEFIEEKSLTDRNEGPDLTPMIDMVFILLVFFLLTSFVLASSIEVALPESETGQAMEKNGVLLVIQRDGLLRLEDRVIDPGRLLEELAKLLPVEGAKNLIIQSDTSVPFGQVVAIMDAARKAGITSISFQVEYTSARE